MSSSKIIDGKALSIAIREEIALEAEKVLKQRGRAPHLAAVLVGDNPASKSYVGGKVKACEKAGFASTLIHKESSITQEELLTIVNDLNTNPEVDGFIVQLPLPDHIDAEVVTLAIDPKKDVDGFHPINFGRMAQGLGVLRRFSALVWRAG